MKIVALAFLLSMTSMTLAKEETAPAFMKIAVVQLSSSDVGDFEKMKALAYQSKKEGAELVVFPEASVFGWLNPSVFLKAEDIPGKFSDKFAEIAKDLGIWIAAGLAEKSYDDDPSTDAYYAYDSAILVDPKGEIVLHHRKHNVIKNAFDPRECEDLFGKKTCEYTEGDEFGVKVADTPFGRTAIVVCADAYTTTDLSVLEELKTLRPDLVIVPWGVTAGQRGECGQEWFNATEYAAKAAKHIGTAYVVGANGTGPRPHGRFLPSWYCGYSGFAAPDGQVAGVTDESTPVAVFDVPSPANE